MAVLISAIVAGCCALSAGPSAPNQAAAPGTPTPEAVAAVSASTDTVSAYDYDRFTRLSREHPNELSRMYAADSMRHGDYDDAVRHFLRAAYYGDKYSQHRLSLLYWHGVGVGRDPALAYVWADLAAERQYPQFLVLREKMWESLDESQRARALQEGRQLYARYGDDAAKPRFERELVRNKRDVTGSHVGYIGDLDVFVPVVGELKFDSSGDMTEYYDSWRWNPKTYWAVEDAIWKDGNVDVGSAEPARTK